MPESVRVTLVMSGAFEHPGGMVPIQEGYSEQIGAEFAVRSLLTIREPTDINFQHLASPGPRLVIITNVAGGDDERFPSEERKAELALQQVYVGPPECPCLCLLRPRQIGFTLQGTGQAFWLSPGQTLTVRPVHPGQVVPVRVLAFPGAANGG